ncbi:MAG: proline iminopeptidase-family hydrolase [Deltaproteobacteria bacterium]|nr:proline iminopeptidase-family hydrolase [Deltaproteobacteria bacterium]
MREGFLETANGSIWYAVYGENIEKTPVIVLHGGPGFLSMSDGLEFLWEDRPVFFYDQLGCGRSSRAADREFYSVENYVEELDHVQAGLQLNEFYLMGFSWGCALACAYVLDRKPACVKGILLCAPLLSTPAWDADQRRNIALMPPEIRAAIETGEATGNFGDAYQSAMLAYYEKHVCLLSPWPESLEKAFSRLNADVYNAMWGPSEFTVTGKLKDYDLSLRLFEISQPVLLTCGDRDEAGVETVHRFQQRFPRARMAVIPQASHLHQIERPDIFGAVVKDFLRDID